MRPLVVLPALVFPVAVATVWFALRQVGEAARALQAEVARVRPLADEARLCHREVLALRARQVDPRAARVASVD
ncbi:MAG: hypothetical protein ACXIVQ_01735 [Acidimicrobiales bacterium]